MACGNSPQVERSRVLHFVAVLVALLKVDRAEGALAVVGVHFVGENGGTDETDTEDGFWFSLVGLVIRGLFGGFLGHVSYLSLNERMS